MQRTMVVALLFECDNCSILCAIFSVVRQVRVVREFRIRLIVEIRPRMCVVCSLAELFGRVRGEHRTVILLLYCMVRKIGFR